MYRSERWPAEEAGPSPPRSRSSSRRSSASLSRRSSLKKEKEVNKSPPASASSTPKKSAKPHNLDFLVTGKQIAKRTDRANSLPGACPRRPPADLPPRGRKLSELHKRTPPAPATPASPRSHDTTLDDDMSLDLSQVSDFEDMNSKYGGRQKFATSTPLPGAGGTGGAGRARGRARSSSLQSQLQARRAHSVTTSRDSCTLHTCTSASSPHRGGELDYSSVSPEYSGQSSAELSPRTLPARASQLSHSPRSHDLQLSSCCVSTWAECSEADSMERGAESGRSAGSAGGAGEALDGEWCTFWANYNNSLPSVPIKGYYEHCPTPYRTDTIDLADWELSDGSKKRSPDNVEVINNIIRHQGLQLTPRDTQNIIKCAHLLGSVLSRAIERRSQSSDDPELLTKKKTMTLDLKETSAPIEVKEEKKCETATTQTDISLPNTKSAPRIFENILRQLSRSSIDVDKIENKEKSDVKPEVKPEAKNEADARPEANKQVTNEPKKEE